MTNPKSLYSKSPYIIFSVLSLLSISLIFNNNLWFDEAYTLSLIQHNYAETIEILKSDMHPPLYFISLKFFCDIFGYSIIITKIFSVLGYIATLLIGCTVVKKHFSIESSIIYMLVVGATPMSLYFSVQQRSYSWCIFFVTLCFIEALLFIRNSKCIHCVLFVISGLFSAYNHIYALIAVAVIFAFINIYIFIKQRNLLIKILLCDLVMVVGYSLWILPLLAQTKSASSEFWLNGVEPLSLIVFIGGLVISAAILVKKENRKLHIVFAIVSVLSVQVIGLGVTVFIRPLYISRYSVVILGVFALLIAFSVKNMSVLFKRIVCVQICLLNISLFIYSIQFEYDDSMSKFLNRFQEKLSVSDTIVYCDSAFGMMSYYFPDSRHLCTYSEDWFSAFSNVECIEKDEITKEIKPDDTAWLIKNTSTKIPKYIQSNFDYELTDSFKCDFNTFELYSLRSMEK